MLQQAHHNRNFTIILKIISKSTIKNLKLMNFRIQISVEMKYRFLNLYKKTWPKFEQVSKKNNTNHSNYELLINNPLLIFLLYLEG